MPKPDEGRKERLWRALKRLKTATRACTPPVMLMPVTVGAALSWREGNRFRAVAFGVTMLGAAAAHLAANVTNDYFDYAEGAGERASIKPGALDTGELMFGTSLCACWCITI